MILQMLGTSQIWCGGNELRHIVMWNDIQIPKNTELKSYLAGCCHKNRYTPNDEEMVFLGHRTSFWRTSSDGEKWEYYRWVSWLDRIPFLQEGEDEVGSLEKLPYGDPHMGYVGLKWAEMGKYGYTGVAGNLKINNEYVDVSGMKTIEFIKCVAKSVKRERKARGGVQIMIPKDF